MIKPTKISPLSESPEETLDAYILAHSDPEGDYLHRLYRQGESRISPPPKE